MSKISFLSGNSLKLLGALLMLIDHIGVFLFPNTAILRYIGRLSFPIFALMISEGAKYTRNKTIYVLGIATLALLCQASLYLYDNKNLGMSILVTFTLSIVIIYTLNDIKKAFFSGDKKEKQTSLWLFIFVITATYLFTLFFNVDYGFAGVLTPVFASLFDFRNIDAPQRLKKLDNIYIRVLSMGAALVILAFSMEAMQFYSLLAIPLLMIYSEKRGRLNLKYFFYVFYPVHILVLEGISYILA